MSILRRFFKKKSPTTAPVSKLAPRSVRVPIQELHNIRFTPRYHGLPIQPLALANISTTGMALVSKQLQDWPPPGKYVPGQLELKDQKFDVTVRLVHTSGAVIGCSFIGLTWQAERQIKKYFEAEIAALTVSRVPSAALKTEEDGTPHYFQSAQAELFYVEREGSLVRFNLMILGHYVEWQAGSAAKCGYLVESAGGTSPSARKATIRWEDSPPAPGFIDLASRFIKTIRDLPEPARETIIRAIHGRA